MNFWLLLHPLELFPDRWRGHFISGQFPSRKAKSALGSFSWRDYFLIIFVLLFFFCSPFQHEKNFFLHLGMAKNFNTNFNALILAT